MPRDIVFINQWPLEHTKAPSHEPKYYPVGSQDPEVIQITLIKVIKSHLHRLINNLKRLTEEWNSCARFEFQCEDYREVYSTININNKCCFQNSAYCIASHLITCTR